MLVQLLVQLLALNDDDTYGQPKAMANGRVVEMESMPPTRWELVCIVNPGTICYRSLPSRLCWSDAS